MHVKPIVALLACAVLVPLAIRGQAPEAGPTGPVRGLRSADSAARLDAYQSLMRQNVAVTDDLIAQFDAVVHDADKRYGSAKYWTITALGDLRVERATPRLIEILAYQIDPDTVPAGGMRRSLSICYPAAVALAKIGRRDVILSILALADRAKDKTTLRLCAWVLKESLGRLPALTLAKTEQPGMNRNARNLAAIQRFLEKDEEILPWN